MDDEFHVFFNTNVYASKPKWDYHVFRGTTDPGTYWLQNPIKEQGTAILPAGQYVDTYGIALHAGKYSALCQIHKPVPVFRDYDRNAILDFFNGTIDRGMHGINIHRARPIGDTLTVDGYSAGCQVFANAHDFDLFMQFCQAHRGRYGNVFTYTLVDFRAVRRTTLRRVAYGLTGGLGAALAYWYNN
ncbi:MAG: hypothetical protein JKX76_02995 [Colwellia sp.]|nr:hypothetical protein [Colwellia sp.]